MKLRAINRLNLSRAPAPHGTAALALAGVGVMVCLLATASVRSASDKRAIRYDDLPVQLCAWLDGLNIRRETFATQIDAIDRQTDQRELRGEYDHLIFFLLQSSRFTRQPKIEPAVSAYEFTQGLTEAERARFLADGSDDLPPRERIPHPVNARIADFLKALRRPGDDVRLNYFAGFLRQTAPDAAAPAQHLQHEYARSMRFLYRKEFASRAVRREELAAFVASLYQSRGHSTDTQVEANFAVHNALAALKAGDKARSLESKLNKVLIVGPGLDFAPRTDLIDLFGPQSYQPFAVADALLSLQLADRGRLQIHCVDINDRVIAHLQNLRRKNEVTLSLLSGIKDNPAHPLTDDYKNYFREFGKSIGVLGTERSLEVPAQFAAHLKKALRVRPEIISAINVDKLNIITERYQDSPQYDLVVVTNVFPYFGAPELLFALTNIAAMMVDGGYLVHNELQTIPADFVTPLGLPLQQTRTVMIASGGNAPLFDGVAVHRKVSR